MDMVQGSPHIRITQQHSEVPGSQAGLSNQEKAKYHLSRLTWVSKQDSTCPKSASCRGSSCRNAHSQGSCTHSEAVQAAAQRRSSGVVLCIPPHRLLQQAVFKLIQHAFLLHARALQHVV